MLDSANFSAEVGKLDFRLKGGRNHRPQRPIAITSKRLRS